MVTGRGNMGSTKHFFSGRGGPSPKQKFLVNKQNNDDLNAKKDKKRKQNSVELYPTVTEAFRCTRKL